MVHKKHDANGNPICRSNRNLILDTCLYEGEFPGEEITELAVNIITESVYAQCDVNGNEYLLLEALINHRKDGSVLSVENQRVVLKGEKPLESQQLVGTFVANGKADPHH